MTLRTNDEELVCLVPRRLICILATPQEVGVAIAEDYIARALQARLLNYRGPEEIG